jgi:hypothetical protein
MKRTACTYVKERYVITLTNGVHLLSSAPVDTFATTSQMSGRRVLPPRSPFLTIRFVPEGYCVRSQPCREQRAVEAWCYRLRRLESGQENNL